MYFTTKFYELLISCLGIIKYIEKKIADEIVFKDITPKTKKLIFNSVLDK